MQTSGTFDIVIQMPSDTEGTANAGTPAQPMQDGKPVQEDPVRGDKNKKDGGGGATAVALTHVAMNAGKQAVNAAIGNIGLASGNYYMQKKVERGTAIATKAIAYGAALATGNVIAGVAMLAGDAINYANESFRMNKEREIADYQSAQYARKLGYTNARR